MVTEATMRASTRDEPVISGVKHGSSGASTGGRETRVSVSVTSRYHFRVGDEPDYEKLDPDTQTRPLPPQPSPLFWRQAWIKFQRALDPLALPKPLPRTQLDQECPRERPKRRKMS
jgi:hypothetical protein